MCCVCVGLLCVSTDVRMCVLVVVCSVVVYVCVSWMLGVCGANVVCDVCLCGVCTVNVCVVSGCVRARVACARCASFQVKRMIRGIAHVLFSTYSETLYGLLSNFRCVRSTREDDAALDVLHDLVELLVL